AATTSAAGGTGTGGAPIRGSAGSSELGGRVNSETLLVFAVPAPAGTPARPSRNNSTASVSPGASPGAGPQAGERREAGEWGSARSTGLPRCSALSTSGSYGTA